MTDVLRHRGPDETGFYLDDGVGLANARLSIIDIEGGHQPIRNEDGTIHVTYNGEIYNFRELRRTLETLGHRFYTESDTEIIVHSYEQFGESFVARLNAMFAIALWDSRNKKLILARDRIGIKPLYYSLQDGNLLFASELKGILQSSFRREVDKEALFAILNLGYLPGDKTLLKGIRKLPPSSLLVYQDGSARTTTYWEIPEVDKTTNQSFVVERLRFALEEAIRDQLVADVPLGCFLSGGLDTSTIVAFASKVSSRPLKTFCMGFGEETDELRDARLVAERFGTEHQELIVDSSQGMKLYPKMIWHMEAPKSNLYPWFVCELVHRHVKVCLSGNGGDEIFGGYPTRYENALRVDSLARKPASYLFRYAGRILQGIPRDISTKNRIRVLECLGDNASEYLVLTGVLPDSFNRKLFRNDGCSLNNLRQHYSPFFQGTDFVQGYMNAELRTKLVDDYLSVDDSMSMAHSLEVRVPLLDNRIVDLMVAVPWKMKYAPGAFGKLLLRKAVRDVLPEKSLRKPKQGFGVNVYSWYKGEIGELIRQVLPESEVVSKYLSQSLIQKLLARATSPRDQRFQVLLWQLLGFHFWHRIFIDSERAGAVKLEIDALLA